MRYLIYKIKLAFIAMILVCTISANQAQAKFCDHHPKICKTVHTLKVGATVAWKGTKWFCNETVGVVQFAVGVATLVALGVL